MNSPSDMSAPEMRDAVLNWADDRFAALKKGTLTCLTCGETAEVFRAADPRLPYCEVDVDNLHPCCTVEGGPCDDHNGDDGPRGGEAASEMRESQADAQRLK
jgi:hypothetical protein